MKYFKWFNLVCCLVLIAALYGAAQPQPSPIDGFFKRAEVIMIKGEDQIELTTHVDFLAQERKYTSIINISDVDQTNQYSEFSVDGDIYSENGVIVSQTQHVEQMDALNKPLMFAASSSPIISQIQKSFLGVDIYQARRYQYAFLNQFFCYYDVEKHIARCME